MASSLWYVAKKSYFFGLETVFGLGTPSLIQSDTTAADVILWKDVLIQIRTILENLSQIASYIKDLPEYNPSFDQIKFYLEVTSGVERTKQLTDLLCNKGNIVMKRCEPKSTESEKTSPIGGKVQLWNELI